MRNLADEFSQVSKGVTFPTDILEEGYPSGKKSHVPYQRGIFESMTFLFVRWDT